MKVYKYLKAEHIFLDVPRKDKDAVIRFVTETFTRCEVVINAQQLYESMQEREATMSTGIGKGIGIPHAVSPEVETPTLLLVRLSAPIDYEAIDGDPVDIILALVIPEHQTSLHLQILAGISRLCENTEFLDHVRNADNPENLKKMIKHLEEKIAFH